MIKVIIPVYYTKEYKTKDPKTFLLSLNWYRNAHHMEQNTVKKHLEELIANQLKDTAPINPPFAVSYYYYYTNAASDLPNVGPLASKWLLDTLQHLKLIKNDSVKYLPEEHYYALSAENNNPRIEAFITEKENNVTKNTIIKRRSKQSVQ